MSDIGVKISRKNMRASNFECRTNFHRKNAKKRPKAFNFLIEISKNRCVINATAAPLIREIKRLWQW